MSSSKEYIVQDWSSETTHEQRVQAIKNHYNNLSLQDKDTNKYLICVYQTLMEDPTDLRKNWYRLDALKDLLRKCQTIDISDQQELSLIREAVRNLKRKPMFAVDSRFPASIVLVPGQGRNCTDFDSRINTICKCISEFSVLTKWEKTDVNIFDRGHDLTEKYFETLQDTWENLRDDSETIVRKDFEEEHEWAVLPLK
eukprot:TRINITY_DN13937_c0_g1_i6.p2 TRINITY_DN13937_c0_g1~~TRINITY_DN13937_c0_g1_i6.p2  ORF type:complete len:198 (-),score=17.98 TRINITY_DN13937_c0_g1_i6:917-1510(-)